MNDSITLKHRPTVLADRSSARPVIAVVITSNRDAEILVESGALAVLGARADLRFIAHPEVTAALPGPSEHLKLPSLATRVHKRFDHHMWYHALFTYLRRHGINHRTSFKATQLRPSSRLMHRIMALPIFSDIVTVFDRRVFFRRDREAVRHLTRLRPSLVLTPGSAIDSYSHMVMRSAKYLGIPTAMIITHWDYFSKKGLLRVSPDRIYAWGKDMVEVAVEKNGIDSKVVQVVGAAQFEKYRHISPETQSAARATLSLPANGVLVLFAGTAAPFDELSVLRELSEVVAQPRFADCRIVYRQHPRAWDRKYAETIDPEKLPNVILDKAVAADLTSDVHYTALLSAVDGVVSPFSTLGLEGALAGKLSFCFAFADNVNPWNYGEVVNSEHIQSIAGRNWLVACRDRGRLKTQFAEYLDLLRGKVSAEQIHGDVRLTVYFDDRSYAQRLAEQIDKDFRLNLFPEKRDV